jgi:hypothetical protein
MRDIREAALYVAAARRRGVAMLRGFRSKAIERLRRLRAPVDKDAEPSAAREASSPRIVGRGSETVQTSRRGFT